MTTRPSEACADPEILWAYIKALEIEVAALKCDCATLQAQVDLAMSIFDDCGAQGLSAKS